MNLYLVTFTEDLMQFVVNAENEDLAILSAHNHNRTIGNIDEVGFWDSVEQNLKNFYEIEKIDFDLLCEIFKRTDWISKYYNSFAFNG